MRKFLVCTFRYTLYTTLYITLYITQNTLYIVQAFVARGEKIFKIDDVFVTGILAKEAGGVKHRFKCHHTLRSLNVIIFTSHRFKCHNSHWYFHWHSHFIHFVTGILAKEAGGVKHRLKCHLILILILIRDPCKRGRRSETQV